MATPPTLADLKKWTPSDESTIFALHITDPNKPHLAYGVMPDGAKAAIISVLTTLISSWPLMIMGHYFQLLSNGKIIDGIHPLTYWEFVLEDPSRREMVQTILDQKRCVISLSCPNAWIFNIIREEFLSGMALTFNRLEVNKLLEEIPNFAKTIGRSHQEEKLLAFTQQRDWEGFINHIMY